VLSKAMSVCTCEECVWGTDELVWHFEKGNQDPFCWIFVLHRELCVAFYQKALIVLHCSCILSHLLHFTKKALLGTNVVN